MKIQKLDYTAAWHTIALVMPEEMESVLGMPPSDWGGVSIHLIEWKDPSKPNQKPSAFARLLHTKIWTGYDIRDVTVEEYDAIREGSRMFHQLPIDAQMVIDWLPRGANGWLLDLRVTWREHAGLQVASVGTLRVEENDDPKNNRGYWTVSEEGGVDFKTAAATLLLTRQQGKFGHQSTAYFNREKGFEWTIEVDESGLSIRTWEYPDDCPSDAMWHYYRIIFGNPMRGERAKLVEYSGPYPEYDIKWFARTLDVEKEA